MDSELRKNLSLIQNKGALTNGEPTGQTFDNTTDSLESIKDNVGSPSVRANFQSLETMLGIPDAVNSNVDDILRTGFDSSGIAANEDGSLTERLEQVQEAVNRGSGTSLAANKSLVDALGTDGTTVTDAAVSVLGAIGADNNNNAFASTNVAANVDGSVLERLEHLILSVLDVKRSETIVSLTDAWNDEDGINGNVWVTAVSGTATAARNTAEAGKLKVRLDAVAGAQTSRLRSYDRFSYAPSMMTGAHIVRKTVLEFEGKFTNLANVDEANFVLGFTPATGDTRATNDIAGFIFTGAPAAGTLSSVTDNGGVETTNVVGTGLTLTNWHKYMIEIYDDAGTATIRFVVTDGVTTNTLTHTANIPTQNGFIQFYNVDDNAGGTFAIFDVGKVRLYSYDSVRY